MYLCPDCGWLGQEPQLRQERHGLDQPPYEMWLTCPRCGGGLIV